MEQDARRWHSHAMGYREYGADLVHCIPATCNQTFGVSAIELYLTYLMVHKSEIYYIVLKERLKLWAECCGVYSIHGKP